MNRFIVISPDTDRVHVAVENNFSERHYQIMPGVWAVASEGKTPSEVCEVLGISGKHGNTGMVFSLGAYYGFYDPILWEKLNNWGE